MAAYWLVFSTRGKEKEKFVNNFICHARVCPGYPFCACRGEFWESGCRISSFVRFEYTPDLFWSSIFGKAFGVVFPYIFFLVNAEPSVFIKRASA